MCSDCNKNKGSSYYDKPISLIVARVKDNPDKYYQFISEPDAVAWIAERNHFVAKKHKLSDCVRYAAKYMMRLSEAINKDDVILCNCKWTTELGFYEGGSH